ncbi:MAG: sensor histidine kinase [Ferrimicrobium sp.]
MKITSLRSWQAWLRARPAPFRWLAAAVGSIQARTTLAATVVVGFVLFVALGGVTLTLRAELYQNVVNTAKNEAYDIVSLVRAGRLPNPLPLPRGDLAAQVVEENGTVVSYTPNLRGRKPLRLPSTIPAGGLVQVRSSRNARVLAIGRVVDSRTVFVAVPVPISNSSVATRDGSAGTKSTKSMPPGKILKSAQGQSTFYVYTLASLASVDQSIETLLRVFFVVYPVIVLIVGVSTRLLTGRAFRPVEQMRADVDDITGSNLARRVFQPDGDDEIARLAATMNQMLARLEQSVELQKQFIADASHELKSPLSALRAALEVGILHADATDWRYTASVSLLESERMQRLIEDLLLLARADARISPSSATTVDIDELCREEVARLRRSGVECRFDLSRVQAGRLRGDREHLRSVVRNLLENAARHAESVAVITLIASRGSVVLSVEDDGEGIASERRVDVFERFKRLDEARSRQQGGSGLGLAIVKSVVVGMGGSVWIEDSTLGGARFVVLWRGVEPQEPIPLPPGLVVEEHV